jgi:hypothetical protein
MIRLRFAFESFFNVDLIAEVVAIKSFDGASPRLFWPTYAWANVGHPSREPGYRSPQKGNCTIEIPELRFVVSHISRKTRSLCPPTRRFVADTGCDLRV